MLTLNIKAETDDISIIKKILSLGLLEERKKVEYALSQTYEKIKEFEEKYKRSSDSFLANFKENKIEENDDTFTWYAELKLEKELSEKLRIIKNIELC